MDLKPNHVCANSKCRKKYYACNYCDRTSYKRIACSPECYAEVVRSAKEKNEHTRIDKTPEEVAEIMSAPIEQVLESSIKEISQVIPNVEEIGINEAVRIINKKLDAEKPKKKRKKKTEVKKDETVLS